MTTLAVTALKVLMVGNSFSLSNTHNMPQICQDLGLELELGSMYIGGCSLEAHAKNMETAIANPASRPYQYDLYRGGKQVKEAPKRINLPEAAKSAKWDVITIQQASHFSWRAETYRTPANQITDKPLREWCPGAEIVVHETWSYETSSDRLVKWGIDQTEMYRRLHRAYYDYAASKGYRVIPAGTAVQLWRQRLPVKFGGENFGGDVCGQMRGRKADTIHLNKRGEYLQSLVWTAKLFGADVRKCKWKPDCVSEAEAVLMREIAMDAVWGVRPHPAFGGVEVAPAVRDGMSRLKLADIGCGEIVELDLRPNSLRVGLVLRPTERSYIRTEVALPYAEHWSGRLVAHGCGGWAGLVGCPDEKENARVQCDLGTSRYHISDNDVPVEVLDDFGWRATHLMAEVAKKLIVAYYGKGPHHSYYLGASTGGGQGMCEAQRYPGDFDGIYAGVPAFDRAALAGQMIRIARLRRKYGYWFTDQERDAIHRAELDWFSLRDPDFAKNRFALNPKPDLENIGGVWKFALERMPSLAAKHNLWRELLQPFTVRGRVIFPACNYGTEFYGWTDFLMFKQPGIASRSHADATDEEILRFADSPRHQFLDVAATKRYFKRGGKMIADAGYIDPAVPEPAISAFLTKLLPEPNLVYYRIPGRSHGGSPSSKAGDWQNNSYAGWLTGDALGGPLKLLIAWVEQGQRPAAVNVPLFNSPRKFLSVSPEI